MFTTAGHLLITYFSFQSHSAVYMGEFVCEVKQFILRACPTFLMLKEMYFLVVISTVRRLRISALYVQTTIPLYTQTINPPCTVN